MKTNKVKSMIYTLIVITLVAFTFSGCTTKKDVENADKTSLIGEWQSQQGTLFTFDEDGHYGYYKDGDDRDDNFYKGTYTFQYDREAMDELGITSSEFAKLQKSKNIEQKDIFAVKMKMETLFSEGIDKSANLNKADYYYFAFYLLPDNKAIAVNMSTFDQMELSRLK